MTAWKTKLGKMNAEWRESLNIYIEGLADYCDKYKLSVQGMFDAAEHRTIDDDSPIDDLDDVEEIQFQIGYITCAAEMLGILPEVLMRGLGKDKHPPKLKTMAGGKS